MFFNKFLKHSNSAAMSALNSLTSKLNQLKSQHAQKKLQLPTQVIQKFHQIFDSLEDFKE